MNDKKHDSSADRAEPIPMSTTRPGGGGFDDSGLAGDIPPASREDADRAPSDRAPYWQESAPVDAEQAAATPVEAPSAGATTGFEPASFTQPPPAVSLSADAAGAATPAPSAGGSAPAGPSPTHGAQATPADQPAVPPASPGGGFVLAGEPAAVAPTGAAAVAIDEIEGTRINAIYLFFRGFVRDLAFFIGLFLFIYYFVMNVSVVRGKSMEPTFHDGDRLIVDKISYRLGNLSEINRFDVIVLKNPRNPAEDYIKRLIAFPGEFVTIRNGELRIDGVRMDFEGANFDRDNYSYEVKEGHYFVLGDNRARSNDSRYFEGVPRDYIKGKIRMRFWPPEELRFFGRYRAREDGDPLPD